MNNIHKNPYICPWSVKTIIHRFKTSNIELVPSTSPHNLQPSSSSLLSRQLSMPSHIFATGIQLLLLHLKWVVGQCKSVTLKSKINHSNYIQYRIVLFVNIVGFFKNCVIKTFGLPSRSNGIISH